MNKASSLVLTLAAAVAFISCKPAPPPAPAEPAGTPTPAATPTPTPTATPTATPTPAPTATPTPAETPPTTPPPSAASTPAEPTPSPTATPAGADGSASLDLKDPVAIVDGEKISKAQLDEAFDKAVQMTGIKASDLTPEQKLEGYRQILDELITEKLVNKAAAGITVPQADVDAQIAKIKAQFPSNEDFSKQLSQVGQTPEQLSETIRKMLQQQRWLESQLTGKTEVTEEEAKKFYEENKTEFTQPETVKASHILFRVNKEDSEEVVNQKLKAAQGAEARAKKGGRTSLLSPRNSPKSQAPRSQVAISDFSRRIAWFRSLPKPPLAKRSVK